MNSIIFARVLAVVCFCAGWAINGWRIGEEVQTMKAEHSAAITDAVRETARALAAMTKDRDAKADLLTAIDLKFTTQLTKARNENKALAARLAAGTTGLRIAATCPAVDSSTTGTAQSGSVDSGAGAVLDPVARQAYSALRDNITTTEATLTVCQKSLAVFSPPTPQESP